MSTKESRKVLSTMLVKTIEMGVNPKDAASEIVDFCVSMAMSRSDLMDVLRDNAIDTEPFAVFIDSFWKEMRRDEEHAIAMKQMEERRAFDVSLVPDFLASNDAFLTHFFVGFTHGARLNPSEVATRIPPRLVSAYKARIQAMYGSDPSVS